MIALLGLGSALAWAAASPPAALSCAAGAALGLLSFVSIKHLSLILVGRAIGSRAAVVWTVLKWCVVTLAFAWLLQWRLALDGVALAVGISCLPAAVLVESMIFSWQRRTDGARIHMGG